MCRFLPPPGRQQNRTANLRYLVFFEIRLKNEKDANNKNIEIIWDVSLFAASGTATKSHRESPLDYVFWNPHFFFEKMRNVLRYAIWIKTLQFFAENLT